MKNLHHANKQDTAYRINRKALNKWGKEKDWRKAGRRKRDVNYYYSIIRG